MVILHISFPEDMIDFLLGSGKQGELWDILVDEVEGDAVSFFALSAAVSDTQPESSLHIIIGNLDVSGQDILPPVELHSCSGFH